MCQTTTSNTDPLPDLDRALARALASALVAEIRAEDGKGRPERRFSNDGTHPVEAA